MKLDFHDLNQYSTLVLKDEGIGDGLKIGEYLHFFSFNERLKVSSKLKVIMMMLIYRGLN